jgi:hypothetical protein
MKRFVTAMAVYLVVTSVARASVLVITLAKPDGHDTQFILGGREVTREELVKQMSRVAKITTDIDPIIRVMKDIPSSDLFDLLADLRKLGLRSFVIMAHGSSGAVSGTHVFTINTSSNQVGFCVGPVETRDFIPGSDPELEKIEDVEREAIKPEPDALPDGPAKLSSAQQK